MKIQQRSKYGYVIATAALLFPAVNFGCQKASSRPQLTKVSGMVVVDGEVAEGIVLTLIPKTNGPAIATGVSGEDGRFEISTFEFGDGALPGGYDVTCVWSEFNPLTRAQVGDRLNGRYATKETTPIHFDVIQGESFNAGKLELTTNP